MRGNETFKIAVRSIETFREIRGLTPDDVSWFIPHQANRIIDAVTQRLGIPAERCDDIDRYGNTSAASIPVAWTRRCAPAGETGRRHLDGGLRSGLTWAASAVRW
jgi:3-oxoacyl-[acyl-carrier-protein] synthase-3